MMNEIGKHLPRLYLSDFGSDDEASSDREILFYNHPITYIKDGEFDDEWNHITPLVCKTARGIVKMEMMEETGKCIIESKKS